MIVCRKPWTLYDVDLAGLAGSVLLGLAAWWLVLAPWRALWQDYRTLSAARVAEEKGLRNDLSGLNEFERELAELERVVVAQTGKVPAADTISHLLRKLADLAAAADLELLSVAPQPAAADGEHMVSDVQVGGRGRSHDFIRFLDLLAQENPYQSLLGCAISHTGPPEQPVCDLSWTVRMYLLPARPAERGGVP